MIAYYYCDSIAIALIDAIAKIYHWVGVAQTRYCCVLKSLYLHLRPLAKVPNTLLPAPLRLRGGENLT